jgi:hypothetical protein
VPGATFFKEMDMVPTGLTFDEYVDLKVRPRAGADRAFHEAADMEREAMFPMNLAGASSHLRSRGYDCRPEMLDVLIRNQVVTPAGPDVWSRADVDAAAEHFEQCEILTPYAAMCVALGCRYADFLPPLLYRIAHGHHSCVPTALPGGGVGGPHVAASDDADVEHG